MLTSIRSNKSSQTHLKKLDVQSRGDWPPKKQPSIHRSTSYYYYYALGVVPERVILLLLCYNATPPTPAYSRRLHSCSGPTPRFTRSS